MSEPSSESHRMDPSDSNHPASFSIFELEQQVRFGHVDPAGIAYFPRIFDYIHEAFEDFWERHVGVRYYHLLQQKRIGFPLVNSDVNFSHPLRFGDRPKVRMTCFRLGRSSFGLRYRYFLEDTLCLHAQMTTVCVDLNTMESIEIPKAYRERIAAIQEDQ